MGFDDRDGWCDTHNEPLREDCWSCRDTHTESYWKQKLQKDKVETLRKVLAVCEGISYDAVEKLLREEVK